jgi:SPP1 family predicted phage head-tail adaptor
MDIGSLKSRVVIQSQAAGQDADGQPNGAWTTLATVWANIRYGTGAEAIRGGAVGATSKVSIRIRKRTDVTTAMQVTYGGVTYQIVGVLPDMTGRKWLDLVCEVIV